ncbi:MAG TPA: patatin family protein [Firmicutes bacterium]|nr:patatin family protein [Bacillota bacterium]
MEQGKKVKSALVIQGGGTRGIYAAGVLDAFLLNKISFPYIIGTSAGSLCGANYLSKDFGRSKYVVTELMSDPKFVSVRNRIFKGTIFDFDFLFHEVPKSILPFNEKEFFNSSSLFYMVATDMNSGKTIYFEKNAISDPYKGLAASSSLPLLSKPVNVDGYLCLDGGVAMSVPFRKPLEEEIEKIVVIATRNKGYRKKEIKNLQKIIAKSLYKDYPLLLNAFLKSHEKYNKDMDLLDRLEEEGRVCVIRPDFEVNVGVACKDKQELLSLYDRGFHDGTSNINKIKKYLGDKYE